MAFMVGQKVECIDDAPRDPFKWDRDPPINGAIYTIRGFKDAKDVGAGLLLCEIRNKITRGGITDNDAAYGPVRFRPIFEKKTDISIFTEILHKATKRQDA